MAANLIHLYDFLAISLFLKISGEISVRKRTDISFPNIITQPAADRKYIRRLIGSQPRKTCRKTGIFRQQERIARNGIPLILQIPSGTMIPHLRSRKPNLHSRTKRIQGKSQLLIRIFVRNRLRAVMGMELAPFLPVVILVTQIPLEQQLLPRILLVGSHFQVVYKTIRQLYIP